MTVLTDLINWFGGGKSENRREHPRAKKQYKAAYSVENETWQPAIGVDISDGGMCILSQVELPEKQFTVRATLDARLVNMRCAPMWHNKVLHAGKPVFCYGLKFVAIGADEWDIVVRWIAAVLEDSSKSLKQDEVARFIPADLQERLLAELVQRGRLQPVDGKSEPLVQLEYGGIAPWRGRKMHRLTIRSRVINGAKEEKFATRFMFDETGQELLVLN